MPSTVLPELRSKEPSPELLHLIDLFFRELQREDYFVPELRDKLTKGLLEEAVARDKMRAEDLRAAFSEARKSGELQKARNIKRSFEEQKHPSFNGVSDLISGHLLGTVGVIESMGFLGLLNPGQKKIVSQYWKVFAAMEVLKRARHVSQFLVESIMKDIERKSLAEREQILKGFFGIDFERYLKLDNERAVLERAAKMAEISGKSPQEIAALRRAAKAKRKLAESFISKEITWSTNLLQLNRDDPSRARNLLLQGAREDKRMGESWLALMAGPERYKEMVESEREKRLAQAKSRRRKPLQRRIVK